MSVNADGGPDDRLTPVLRPVRAGNGFEEALEQILQVVRLGLVPGGERLPAERELAERLGISRATLREVLRWRSIRKPTARCAFVAISKSRQARDVSSHV